MTVHPDRKGCGCALCELPSQQPAPLQLNHWLWYTAISAALYFGLTTPAWRLDVVALVGTAMMVSGLVSLGLVGQALFHRFRP